MMTSSSSEKIVSETDCDTDDRLCATFYENNANKSKPFQVTLSSNALCIRKELEAEELIDICDIVGSRCSQKQFPDDESAHWKCASKTYESTNANLNVKLNNCVVYLHIYCYEFKKKERRDRRVLTLCFSGYENAEGNKNEAEKWKKRITASKFKCSLSTTDQRPILVILNPKSGCGKAREFFNNEVKPILMEAELPFDLRITKYANFASEFTKQAKDFMNTWRSIIVVGGDGLYWEVLNGILERIDAYQILNALPIGIVPCGSGNGLAKTISHLYQCPFTPQPVLNAAIACVSGRTAPMDIVRVQTKNKTIHSFLAIGWGIIADIDIESEFLRFLGYQRFTVWSLYRILILRSYYGKLSYIPKENKPSSLEITKSDWTVEEGEFVMVHATYQTHLAEDCFFAPDSKLNDGIIYLVVIRKGVSRIQMVSFLLGMSTGTHLSTMNNTLIQVIPVTAFRIEPAGTHGILTVDGERMDYGPIECHVCEGVAKIMVPK